MTLITKMPPRVYMQRVCKNRDIYYDVKTLKCTSEWGNKLTLGWFFALSSSSSRHISLMGFLPLQISIAWRAKMSLEICLGFCFVFLFVYYSLRLSGVRNEGF